VINLKRVLLPLCLLICVSILSGCVGQGGTTPTGNGINIKEFSFDYSPIDAGTDIGLNLEVQNIGGDVGTLKKISVFGIDYKSGSADALKWGLPSGENFIMSNINVNLLPPDKSTGFEGDVWSTSWLPQAPTGVQSSTDYDFEIRVEYGYDTTYTGTITIVANDYLRTLPKEQRDALIKQGGVVESTVTSGPMSISAASGEHFIVRNPDTEKRTIKFKITNVGNGYPYDTELNPSNLYVVRIPKSGLIGLTDCDNTTKLSKGKNGWLSCKIEIPGTNTIVNKLDRKFSISLSYEYYVDSSATISVNPTYTEATTMPGGTSTTSTTSTPTTTIITTTSAPHVSV
jgi:hypothetical protein